MNRYSVILTKIFAFCLSVVLFFTSCTSLQQDVSIPVRQSENSADVIAIETRLAVLDAATFMPDDKTETADRNAACAVLIDDVDALLSAPEISKSVQARFWALKGRILLLSGKKSRARSCWNTASVLFGADPQTVILGARLGEPVDLDKQIAASDERALLLLERALRRYTAGQFSGAVADFDTAFMTLEPFYRTAYGGVRDRAWKFHTAIPAQEGKDASILQYQNITVSEMMLAAQQTSDILFNYTAGKNLSEKVLFNKLTGAGLVSPVSAAFSADTVLAADQKATRIICARFLWNLYIATKEDPASALRYSRIYRKTSGLQSPIPDIPLDSPDFDAAAGCVETELMDLPDGVHFFPDRCVDAVDFCRWLSYIKQPLR
jgi:hypothetical protein